MTKELLLNQVITGKVSCRLFDEFLYVKSMTSDQRLHACQIYEDILYEARVEGVLTDEQMIEFLIQNGLWSTEEEAELESSHVRVDALKEEMYRRYASFNSAQVEKIRRLLVKSRIRAGELFQKRHSYDMYTCNGLALMYQLHYLLINNTVTSDGKHIRDRELDDIYLRLLAEQYVSNRASEATLRELSKFDGWKAIWHAAKGSSSLFGIPAIDLSEEQRGLIGWSRLYDNIAEAVEQLDKVVLEDDDLLDGWLIIQHKKREEERKQANENVTGKAKPGAQEIFIPAETPEDAARIFGMNDTQAQITRKQRQNVLVKKGKVSEEQMPDSKLAMILQATQEFHARMQNK